MEAVISALIMMFNIVRSFYVRLPLRYHFSRTSKFICGSDPKMCIHTDNECQQEVFQISYPRFV